MRLHRFYVSQPLGEEVVIDDVSQVFQWTNVFRYTEGDFVILFNGDGNDCSYSLKNISKKSCTLTRTKQDVSYIPTKKITLCLSLIKKDNFELVVQKATELGVTTIIPVLSSRSEKKNLSYERLEKIAKEAGEQCGRGDIPVIKTIVTLKEALGTLTDQHYPLVLSMGGVPLLTAKDTFNEDKELMLFIGPEGGFSSEDMNYFKECLVAEYSLGKTVLRAETAAIVAVALLSL